MRHMLGQFFGHFIVFLLFVVAELFTKKLVFNNRDVPLIDGLEVKICFFGLHVNG
jgi:hypothetical protein